MSLTGDHLTDILTDLSSWGSDTPKKPVRKVLSKVVAEKPKRKKAKKKEKKPEPETMDLTIFSDDSKEDSDGENIPFDEQIKIEARRKKAEMIIKEEKAKQELMLTAVQRGKYLKRELFFDYMTPFIDSMLGDVQRMGSAFLTDIGKQIVEAGNVTPEIRSKWDDMILEKQDDSKKEVIKRLKEIDKIQGEK